MRGATIPQTVLLGIIFGAIAGYVDLVEATPWITMAALVIGALIIGFASPLWWWIGALIAGLTVPAAHVFQIATGIPTRFFQTDTFASLLSVMPAMLGGIAGAAIRKGPSEQAE